MWTRGLRCIIEGEIQNKDWLAGWRWCCDGRCVQYYGTHITIIVFGGRQFNETAQPSYYLYHISVHWNDANAPTLTARPTSPPATGTPLTQWIHMLSCLVLSPGLARRKHKSTPTANTSCSGAAMTSPRTFSRGTLAKVPVWMALASPTPVVFATRTRVLWLGVRPVCFIFNRVSERRGQRKPAYHDLHLEKK